MHPRKVQQLAHLQAFADYVQGRSIAVVGTAPLDGDQIPDIKRHDLVYVVSAVNYSHDLEPDIVFLNGEQTRTFDREGWDCLAYRPEWVVTKRRTPKLKPNVRTAMLEKEKLNVNQVTGALLDLAKFDPLTVTVYGADFYVAGPASAYSLTYLKNAEAQGGRRSVEMIEAGIRAHDQKAQRQAIRELIETKGWPVGDRRYLSVVHMTDDEYRRAYTAGWRTPDAAHVWSTL
jgi:hypothetical protein